MLRVLSIPLNRSSDFSVDAAKTARGKSPDRTGQAQILGALLGRSIQSSKVEGYRSPSLAMRDAIRSIRNLEGSVAFAMLTRGNDFARMGASIADAVVRAEKSQLAKAGKPDEENSQDGLDFSSTDHSSNGSVDGGDSLSKQDVQEIKKMIGEAATSAFPKNLPVGMFRGDMRDCADKLENRLAKAQNSLEGVDSTDHISRAIAEILS